MCAGTGRPREFAMYVCHCEAVSDRSVVAAIASGARSIDDVTSRCHAGGGCGSCHELLHALIDAAAVSPSDQMVVAA
jgi:bacterioferritin-associated ferredoxin